MRYPLAYRVIFFLLITCCLPVLACASLLADINQDDTVDLEDAVLVLQVVTGESPTIPPLTNDIDVGEDSKVGLAEVIYLMQEMVDDNLVLPHQVLMVGPLSGAAITAYEFSSGKRVEGGKQANISSTDLQVAGSFSLTLSGIVNTEWIMVSASEGEDVDADGNGVADPVPTANNSILHALAKAPDWRTLNLHISPLTEISYRFIEQLVSEVSSDELETYLTGISRYLVKSDIDGNGNIDWYDILSFDPSDLSHREKLTISYDWFLDLDEEGHSIKDLAIVFIANFAQNGGDAPGVFTYDTAGIENVSPGNIERVNIAISSVAEHDANTEAEIQTIVDALLSVHEDAEDGDVDGWFPYGTHGTITNIEEHGSRAMSFQGDVGLDNGFALMDFNITTEFMASWSMKYSDDFRFFIRVQTSNLGQNVFLEYTPEEINRGHYVNGTTHYLHNGLGLGVNDGSWKTFIRDVETDVARLLPNDTLEAIIGFSVRGAGLLDDIMTFKSTPMWAIGDSTVADYPDDRGDRRGGWAEMLYKHTLYGKPVYNYARSGDSSRTFYEKDDSYTGEYFWYDENDPGNQGAKVHIESIASSAKGGFLFIQFGHNDGNFGTANDTDANFNAEQFGDYITRYVTEAKALNVIPVLVTPVSYLRVGTNDPEDLHQYAGMNGHGGVGDYPQIMESVSINENVLLLDLTQKSYDYYREYFTSDTALEAAYGSDWVHTNQLGATQISKLIKELACDYQGDQISDAILLCKQFRNDVSSEIVTHEDAQEIQDPPDSWTFFSNTVGSTATNVIEHNGRAIELSGAGVGSGFTYTTFPVASGFTASWSLKYNEDFRLFVEARTTGFGEDIVLFEYTPDTSNLQYSVSGSYHLIKNGLGDDANDDSWHTYTRDIEADLKALFPDDTVTEIRAFHIRGSGLLDDLETSSRPASAEFHFNGHRYRIVKTALSWGDASTAAQNDNGYLANIGSIEENHEIYSRLNRYLVESEYGNTSSANGGNAAYVWIGATDTNSEGIWRWSNNQQQFWAGQRGGTATAEQYNNWGHHSGNDGVQMEPDNSGNQQDHAAIALTEWQLGSGNLGQASQWNDLNEANLLYSIIEYD